MTTQYSPIPSPDAIAIELQRLKDLLPRVQSRCPRSAFSDDNVSAINAQIAVIESNMSDQRIYDRYDNDYIFNSAFEARQWLDGEHEVIDGIICPSQGWELLLAHAPR